MNANRIAVACLVLTAAARSAAESPAPPVATLYAFFATWCVPCRSELPEIQRLHDRYAARGLQVVLVSEDGPSSASEVPGFLEQAGITVPFRLDPESDMLLRYHPTASLPFTVLLDRDGQVVFARAGFEPGDTRRLEAEISALLTRSEAAAPPDEPDREVSASFAVQGLGLWRHSRFDPRQDGDLGGAVTRIEPRLARGGSSLTMRMDAALLGDRAPGGQPGTQAGASAADLRLERVLADLDAGPVRIRAGDFYSALGHGMSLSLRRVDPLGTDTALRGGRVDWTVGPVRASALAGFVNPQNFDPIEARLLPDIRDFLGGGEIEVRPAGGLQLEGYGIHIAQPGAAPDGREISVVLGGAAASFERSGIRVSAEGAAGHRTGWTRDPETVHGLTGSVAADLGPLTALVETKWYRHFAFGRADRGLVYHEPPTLEREDQRVPGNEDSIGGRARVDLRAGQGWTLFANATAYRFTEDGSDPLHGGLAWHLYAGADVWFEGSRHFALSGGFRRETTKGGDPRGWMGHVDLDASLPITAALSVQAHLNHATETKWGFSGAHKFQRGLASAGVAWPGHGSVAFLYGYSTEVETRPTHYPGAEARILLPHGGEVRVFGGRMAGGRVCASGTCRDLPPFEGVRLDLVVRSP